MQEYKQVGNHCHKGSDCEKSHNKTLIKRDGLLQWIAVPSVNALIIGLVPDMIDKKTRIDLMNVWFRQNDVSYNNLTLTGEGGGALQSTTTIERIQSYNTKHTYAYCCFSSLCFFTFSSQNFITLLSVTHSSQFLFQPL